MLITALHSDYVFNIEDLNYLYSLVDKYLPGYVVPTEKVKKAEEIAIQAHFHQPYGDHKENGDYYKYHLDVVRKIATGLAKKHSDLHTYKFEIAALLHDYLEDTHPTRQDIENLIQLFGEEMMQSIEKLTYRHDKGYDEYFKAISEDEVAKVVKTADRIANISLP
jgi:(p)ppGpp synthase/HD superfamily hydrolase